MRKVLDIPFGKALERTLFLDALVPEGLSAPHPVLLWLHGGGWHEGNKRNITDTFAKLGKRSGNYPDIHHRM